MIRINLLAVERDRTKPRKVAGGGAGSKQVPIAASAILLLTVAGMGWWFWSLRQASIVVDAQIVQAETETRNLTAVLSKVSEFETRKAQLQQRVTLIEQLRKGQAAPARVLDQISRSVPDRLWLAEMSQVGSDFTLSGFATSMTALSDFVAGIESTTWFKRPVEIIDSQVTADAKTGDLVKFSIKATYFDPDAPPPAVVAKKP
jgi:type IV pilus assembly protein PilN